jgi:nanoRNase/pAp phosphatase (c-di-AMP/oligoRNAs hydrolase)
MHIVTTHTNTDFDALASMIAATILYPGTLPVLPKSLNPNVKAFLSIHKDLFETSSRDQIDMDSVERLIVVDVSSWGRLERFDKLKKKESLEILLWDHHMTMGDLDPTWKCQEATGATISLMVRRLKNERKILTPMQATLFLTGLYEDTGNLSFPSSTAEDAYAAGYLLERGADLNIISSFLRPAYGEKQKDILFKMLQSAKRIKINGYNISVNRQEVKGYVNSLAVVVGMYREILNVDAAFGIFTDKYRDKCMVIGRSNIEGFDVGSIMRGIGGGGHPAAGSALLKSVNPATVESLIFELIGGNQMATVQISDLMSFPVFTVPSNSAMEEVVAILEAKGCTGIPVVDDDNLVGIISRRDLQKVKKDAHLKAPVKAFMQPNVITIQPGKSPMIAARLMVKHDIGRLPVVENGRIIGIVTRSDVMIYFYNLLPD